MEHKDDMTFEQFALLALGTGIAIGWPYLERFVAKHLPKEE